MIEIIDGAMRRALAIEPFDEEAWKFTTDKSADAIIALEDGGVIREGWVLVPREPTEEMCAAGATSEDTIIGSSHYVAAATYRAMISALTVPGLGGDQGEEGDMV